MQALKCCGSTPLQHDHTYDPETILLICLDHHKNENTNLNARKIQRIHPWTPLSEVQTEESDSHTVVIKNMKIEIITRDYINIPLAYFSSTYVKLKTVQINNVPMQGRHAKL